MSAAINFGRTRQMQDITFCATSRTGIGHLRRLSSIAAAIKAKRPRVTLGLITNAPPAGLADADYSAFSGMWQCGRADIASMAGSLATRVLVADTMLPDGIFALPCRRALVLREMPGERLARLDPAPGGTWDVVIVPNPADHWMPDLSAAFTREALAVGWIYRSPEAFFGAHRQQPRLLVATGGGGTAETARAVSHVIGDIVAALRAIEGLECEIVQAVGPRAGPDAIVAGVDQRFDPGGELNEEFTQADAVISTSGYNSVLEIAITTTPAVLVAIDRSLDDQGARALRWGPLVGRAHTDGDAEATAHWLAGVLKARRRRPPVDIGPSGAAKAAEAILELVDR